MAIISFDPDVIIDFVPEYAGNRDTDDPCIVRLKFVPYSRIQQYSKMVMAKTRNTTSPKKIEEITQTVQKRQFIDSVESISGYYVGNREVTDPDEFYETAATALVLEVVKAMEDDAKLTEGQVKNFEPLSAGNVRRKAAHSDVTTAPTEKESLVIAGTNVDSAIEREG